jgi:hypothetical protein
MREDAEHAERYSIPRSGGPVVLGAKMGVNMSGDADGSLSGDKKVSRL